MNNKELARELLALARELSGAKKKQMDYGKIAGQILPMLASSETSWEEFVKNLDAAAEHYPGVTWVKKDGKWIPKMGDAKALSAGLARKRVLADPVLNEYILTWARRFLVTDKAKPIDIFNKRFPWKSEIGAHYNRIMAQTDPSSSPLAKKNAMTNALYVLSQNKNAWEDLVDHLLHLSNLERAKK